MTEFSENSYSVPVFAKLHPNFGVKGSANGSDSNVTYTIMLTMAKYRGSHELAHIKLSKVHSTLNNLPISRCIRDSVQFNSIPVRFTSDADLFHSLAHFRDAG